MVKRVRNGKYAKYEKLILNFLCKQKHDVTAGKIRRELKIPRTSSYDVLNILRDSGLIAWIGEFQDTSISMILLTPKGRKYCLEN